MTTALHPKKAISFIMPSLLCFIMSFNAGAQDYSITTTGNAIVITDLSGNGDNLSVFQSGAGLGFTVSPNTRTYSIDGGAVTAFSTPPAALSLAGATGITVNTAAGNDVIDLQAFTANLPDLTINGGIGNDSVTFKGNINFAANASLDLDMQNDDASPGIDKVKFATSANLVLSGTGAATIKVSKNVIFQDLSLLRTADGNLTIEANQQAIPAPGNFTGINLTSNVIVETTGNGVTTLKGRGGNLGTLNYGVLVQAASKVSCGSTGMVSVTGTGGASTGNNNAGVVVGGVAIATITSAGGNVVVTGKGGGIGTSFANSGVIVNASMITAGGTGTVTVSGTGGDSQNSSNWGIEVVNINAAITSGGGDVNITGHGGDFASDGIGVAVNRGGRLTAGGSGTLTVIGTGGAAPGTNGNIGVYIDQKTSSQVSPIITSEGGNVNVTGQGGGTGASSFCHGVLLADGGMITSGGTGTVTVQGFGGPGTSSDNHGVFVIHLGSMITSSGGDIYIVGTKGINSPGSADVEVATSGVITSAGTGGNVSITSTSTGTFPNTAGSDVSLLPAKTLSFTIGSKLNIDIDGITVDAQYQQLNVVGMIDLSNALLTFTGSSLVPAAGQAFTIVANDGADPITGNFVGLPEGAIISNFLGSSLDAAITYVGGDGNDAVLTVLGPCVNPTIPTLAATENPVCSGSPTTLSIQTGNLNSATRWQWYSGSCGGTAVGSGTSITVSPASTTTYYVRGEGGCVAAGSCASITITVNTPQTWYLDADDDGYYTGSGVSSCSSPGTGYRYTGLAGGNDCNDNDATVHVPQQYYVDADHDGYGSTTTAMVCSSTAQVGYSTNNTDCNDNDATVHAPQQYYVDADHDGYGSTTTAMVCSSTAPVGYSTNNTDCNDNDASVHAPQQYYVDADHDGFGSTTTAMVCSSTAQVGYSTNNTDCNDADGTVHAPVQYYVDADHDGFGSTTTAMVCSSTAPVGYSTNNTDCNDADGTVHAPVQYYVDADHDGFGSTTTAMVCSSIVPVGYSTNNTDCNDADGTVHAPVQYYVDADHDGFGSTTTAMVCSSTAPVGYSTNNTDCNDADGTVHASVQYYVDADHDGFGSTTTAMICSSTAPVGYSTNNTDCNDADGTVHAPVQYYVDADHDGFGSTTTAMLCSSTAPVGYSTNNTDCNDADGTVHAPVQYYVDADHDGFGSTTTAMLCSSTAPVGYSTNNADCNDNDAAIYPVTIWYLDADNDGYYTGSGVSSCSSPGTGYKYTGLIAGNDCDDADGTMHAPVQYYVDADHDGYGSTTTAMLCSSTAPVGYSANNTDCNDADGTVHTPVQYYVDADHDGYGSTTTAMLCSSTATLGYSTNNTDCNDDNAAINPNTKWYKDADTDNYSDGTMLTQCTRPTGYKLASELTAISGDCNDANANIKPGAAEICDGIDNNCDGIIDEGFANTDGDTLANCVDPDDDNDGILDGNDCAPLDAAKWRTGDFYTDGDNDGYGGGTSVNLCYGANTPTGYSTAGGDCNDADANIKPGAVEICGNNIDDNCNSQIDEGCNVCQVTATVSTGTINCYGLLTTITVTAGGGTAPYQYKLSGGSTFQIFNTFIVGAGTYSITVKDKKGCTKTINGIVVTQPAPLTLTLLQKSDVTCRNGSNGKIIVSAGGGTAPYNYKLNSGSYGSSSVFQNLKAGTYTVTAKDAKGCIKSMTVTIKNGSGSCNNSYAYVGKSAAWFVEAALAPNPSRHEFTLSLKGNSSEPVNIRVVDIYGRSMYQTKGTVSQSYKFGQRFTAGVYIVKIIQGEHVKTIKVVKN